MPIARSTPPIATTPRLVGPFFEPEGRLLSLTADPGIEAQGDEVSACEVFATLRLTFGEKVIIRECEHFDDARYYLPTVAEVCHVYTQRKSDTTIYRRGILDCEDFAYWLKADFSVNRYLTTLGNQNVYTPFAVGILLGGITKFAAHTVNVVVLKGKKVMLIDSTTDENGAEPPGIFCFGENRPVTADYIII